MLLVEEQVQAFDWGVKLGLALPRDPILAAVQTLGREFRDATLRMADQYGAQIATELGVEAHVCHEVLNRYLRDHFEGVIARIDVAKVLNGEEDRRDRRDRRANLTGSCAWRACPRTRPAAPARLRRAWRGSAQQEIASADPDGPTVARAGAVLARSARLLEIAISEGAKAFEKGKDLVREYAIRALWGSAVAATTLYKDDIVRQMQAAAEAILKWMLHLTVG